MNKTYTYIAAGIAVVAIAVWGTYAYNHQGNNPANNGQQAMQQDNSNNAVSPAATSTPPIPSAAKKLSYGDAIKAYLERFQFLQCQVTVPVSPPTLPGAIRQ